eukprot:CAMPEP_0181524474 /NCGR_PEP_ID=MMETSP1110-20121109/68452_1 /TAXON_ID=174948 /ORGANISM="Symbiodinium sp., Strain CCMP421" /LENGTH=106 /DNA_ID=CAMNT_0023655211 /DNA_START=137 /DNA_END=456 /DNA_ORIENTATION=-
MAPAFFTAVTRAPSFLSASSSLLSLDSLAFCGDSAPAFTEIDFATLLKQSAPPVVPLLLGFSLRDAEAFLVLAPLGLNALGASILQPTQALSFAPAVLHQDLLANV